MRKSPLKYRYRNTGPRKSTRVIVLERAGDRCEWPDCTAWATEIHHRLNRKMGGRKGERAEQLNGVAWLLAACGYHHMRVTSAKGDQLDEAKDYGWVLLERELAEEIPVAMDGGAYWLDNDGGKELVP
jgi:hypothetical protein